MTVITMSRTEIDRMGVLHDLADGRIKIAEASRLMGLGRRQVFRLAKAFGKHGPEALVSRRRGRPSNRCYPTALRAEVIGIIKDRYSDFGPTLAAEKLAELHGIDLACETLRQWMIVAGLWKDRRARLKPVHQPRHRRDCVGELIQIDGSDHWWFETQTALVLHRSRCRLQRHRVFRRTPTEEPLQALYDHTTSRNTKRGIQRRIGKVQSLPQIRAWNNLGALPEGGTPARFGEWKPPATSSSDMSTKT